MEDFGIFEIVAVLGALAWAPQLYKLYREHFIRPELTIISDKTLEIGYTINGPIINLSLALVSDKKRALVRKVELDLTHENNESHKFTWNWFEETLYEINLPETGNMPTKKNQKAVAIKIDESDLVEKTIGFHQNTFKDEHSRLSQLVTEDFLRFYNSQKPTHEILSEKAYGDLQELYKNSFSWKSGKYVIKMAIHTAENRLPFEHVIKFELNSLNRKTLEFNIPLCERQVHKDYVDHEKENVLTWYWVYPRKTNE